MEQLTLEHATALFLLMLVAQIPILVAAWVAHLKSKAAIIDAKKAATAAADKAAVVERKLDANTVTTEAVDAKADTIVSQTNGSLDRVRTLVDQMAERVDKLESYNHDSTHRLFNAIHAMHLKIAELVALQSRPILPSAIQADMPREK